MAKLQFDCPQTGGLSPVQFVQHILPGLKHASVKSSYNYDLDVWEFRHSCGSTIAISKELIYEWGNEHILQYICDWLKECNQESNPAYSKPYEEVPNQKPIIAPKEYKLGFSVTKEMIEDDKMYPGKTWYTDPSAYIDIPQPRGFQLVDLGDGSMVPKEYADEIKASMQQAKPKMFTKEEKIALFAHFYKVDSSAWFIDPHVP